MDILYFIVVEVFLVDAVQSLDVGVALGFEGAPVEGGGFLHGETVGFCVVAEGFGDRGRVPGYFLWYTTLSTHINQYQSMHMRGTGIDGDGE